jgi:hypothetical protein
MNVRISLRVFAFATALWLSTPHLALAQTAVKPPLIHGQLRLPEFAALTDKASEVVNVSLDPRLLDPRND